MGRFTQLPLDMQKKLTVNAGIIARNFNPATGAISLSDIIGATSGGINVTYTPTYKDIFADLDNAVKNSKEGKRLDSVECMASGTFVTVTPESAAEMIGAADIGTIDTTKIVPRAQLTDADFKTFWVIGDYSDQTGATNGGFIAIKLMNALSTGGFSLQTTDLEKGQFAFEFMAHVSILAPDTMPMEVYIKSGTSEAGDFALEFVSAAGSVSGNTALSGMTETAGAGESYVYQTDYNAIVPSAGKILTGSAWTAWNGSDEITAETGIDIVLAIITTATGACVHAGKTVVVAKA